MPGFPLAGQRQSFLPRGRVLSERCRELGGGGEIKKAGVLNPSWGNWKQFQGMGAQIGFRKTGEKPGKGNTAAGRKNDWGAGFKQ